MTGTLPGDTGPLIVSVADGLCTLTLNRPDKRNALNGAEEALATGLVWQVVEEGALDEAVALFAAQVLANSAHANRSVKRLLLDTEGMALADALAHEAGHYAGMAPDYRERLAAFAKKG